MSLRRPYCRHSLRDLIRITRETGSGRIPVSVDCACQKVRNRLHVLLAELADHLRLSRQTINALETGKYDPSLPLAFKIAHLFGKPIEEIFQSDPELEW